MNITRPPLEGLLLIEPRCFLDDRGLFLESYEQERYQAAGIKEDFVQDNHSCSSRNVLHGFPYTRENPKAQILTVMRGKIFDVGVDTGKILQLSENGLVRS